MKKSQLKNGMVLLTRKGNAAIVFQTKEENLIIGVGSEVGGRFLKTDLNEDLKSSNADFDIVKVYQLESLENVVIRDIKNYINESNLVWEIEKPFELKEFNQDTFRNASEEIRASYAGWDGYKKFRSNKQFYQLEVHNPTLGEEGVESAKTLFLTQIKELVDGRISAEESRLRICCEQDSNQFAFGFHIKINVSDYIDLGSDESEILDVVFRTNDSRVLKIKQLKNPILPNVSITEIGEGIIVASLELGNK